MKLRAEIIKEHSKAMCTSIVEWVGNSQQRFDELFDLFINDEAIVVQRAAWPIGYCVIDHPAFIHKHWAKFLKNLSKPTLHDAVKRNSVRLLQHVDIPSKYQGEVMNICFGYVESPTEAVAIKAFSLAILGNLANQYPEIIPEIKLLIESQLEDQTAAFKSRAKKFLKRFNS